MEGCLRESQAVFHRLSASHLLPARRLDQRHPRRAVCGGQKEGRRAHRVVYESGSGKAVQSHAAVCSPHRDGCDAHEHMSAHVHQQSAHQGHSHSDQQQQTAHLFRGALLYGQGYAPRHCRGKSTLPSATSVSAWGGEVSSTVSSSTFAMRSALARDRVSSRKTLEIIIMEFITWNT